MNGGGKAFGRTWAPVWGGALVVLLVILGLLVLGGRLVPEPEPDPPADPGVVPAFEIELSPGEGRPVFESTGEPLELREAPDLSAARERLLELPEGAEVPWDEARYRTIEPGLVEVVEPGAVSGRDLDTLRYLSREDYSREDYYLGGFPHAEWALEPGDTLEILQHRAEGTCFVRIAGNVVDAALCPTHHPERFRTLAEPVTEWWIRVLEEGSPAGWTLVEERTLRIVDRRAVARAAPAPDPMRARLGTAPGRDPTRARPGLNASRTPPPPARAPRGSPPGSS